MKRILSLILCTVMLMSVIVFDTGAAGTLIFSDDFTTGFPPRNWVLGGEVCRFAWDKENQCIYGYGDAPVLQSNFGAPYNKQWDDFYASFDIQVKADDEREDWPEFTYVRIWYRDLFESDPSGPLYYFSICIQTGEATVSKEHTYTYLDEKGVTQEYSFKNTIAGPVSIGDTIEVGEDAEWFNMGLRVTDGVMQCYYNEQLIIDLKASEDDEKVGPYATNNIDATVGTQKSPFIFFNNGNWVALDNFEVWSADYDFNPVINYGDVDGNGTVNLLDASAIMKYVAGWTSVTLVEQIADADGNGSVNLNDVSLVMKHAAKWDVVLGPTETE